MLHDIIVLENNSYVATRAERIQSPRHWILKLNPEGAQQPLHRRPDFAQATRECKRLHDEHLLSKTVRTRFGCLVENVQTTHGGCEQNTHSNSMYRCAQCITTHTEQNDHISSREHTCLKIAHLCDSQ